MRIIVGIRVKPHVSHDDTNSLRKVLQLAIRALDKVQPWLPEHTETNLRWAPPGYRTAVLFRSNEPVSIPERSGWIGNKQRIWAWSGVVGTELHGSMQKANADDPGIIDSIRDGVGSFALVGATPESLNIYTNTHRSEGMYSLELSDAWVFSNSAAVLSLIRGGGKPEYSRIGMAGFLVHGLPVTESTMFRGIRVIPEGSHIKVSETGPSEYKDPVFTDYGDVQSEDAAEEVTNGLLEYARTLSAGPGKISAAITGGKDSRLVVAALHTAGVEFEAYTNGLPESGEAYIGKTIAETLKVPYKLNVPKITSKGGKRIITADPMLHAWRTLRSTGGLGNAFTGMADPHRPHMPLNTTRNFGGQGGEIIRGGYQRRLADNAEWHKVAEGQLAKDWLDLKRALTPFALEVAQKELEPNFDLVRRDPVRGMFVNYVTNRTGRWLSTMRHGESVVNSHTTLLINNQMVRKLLSLDGSAMLGEKFAFQVMQNLAPEIVALPFFRDRWAFEAEGPSEFFRPETWNDRAPYTAHDQPRADYNWRTHHSPVLSQFFKDYIFSYPDSDLFEVVDRKFVEKFLSQRSGYHYKLAWALFSAQYSLSNAWLESEPQEGHKIEIEVPE